MPRRPNREGSDPALRADGRWIAFLRTPDGRRHSVYGRTTAPLKTSESRRVLVLPARAIDLLRTRQTRQKSELLAAGKPRGNELNLIFTNEDGTPLNHSSVTHSFYRLTRDAGLPHIPFHGLRHIAATLQLAGGASMTSVAAFLGHTGDSSVTRLYTHLLPADRQAAADRTNAQFPPKRKTT